MAFLLKRYVVRVAGFSAYPYDAHSPAAARAQAWRSYQSYRDVPFKDFLKMSTVRRADTPEGYGRPITVGGAPAFYVGDTGQYIRFARPGEKYALLSHPLDVQEVA